MRRVDPWTVATAIVIVALVLSVGAGGPLFGVAVLGFALLCLGCLAAVLARTGHRPLLPAATVAAVGLPALVMWRPSAGWELVPGTAAAMLLGAFVLAIVAPRRRGITTGIGVTVTLGLLVGLGSGGLLLLRSAPRGFRWTAAALVLSLAPHAAAAVMGRIGPPAPGAVDAARVIAAGAAGGGVLMAAGAPLTFTVTAVLTGLALAASFAGSLLATAMYIDAGGDVEKPRPGQGRLLGPDHSPVGWITALLLTAPTHYLVARAVQL